MPNEVMTLAEAVEKRIKRVREPQWSPTDYLRLGYHEGHLVPFADLFIDFHPDTKMPGKMQILTTLLNFGSKDCEEYTGPLHALDDQPA